MKNLFLLLAFLTFQQQLHAQDLTDEFNYKVTYKLTYQEDSTDVESKKEEDMFLYIGNEASRFSSAGTVISDSIMSSIDFTAFNQSSFESKMDLIPKTAFKYHIFKGIPADKMTYSKEIANDKYRYTEDMELFEWSILGETDSIAGFQVQKATTSFAGRDYTAWFTSEIPITDGPYKFNGLPGLILKVVDEKEHYLFEMTEIKKLGEPLPFTLKDDDYIDTPKKKLLELEAEYNKDPIGFLERSIPGVKIEFSGDSDRKKMDRERKERLKKQNNPLELE